MALALGKSPPQTLNRYMADPKATLPHPDRVTNNQIDGLLRIVSAMTGALGVTHSVGLDRSEPVLPEESRAAAELTFWAACDQLQRIIKDSKRWNMDFQKSLEARSDSLFKQQEEFLAAQVAASKEVGKPHFKYRPEMKRIGTGGWICYVGDIEKPDEGNCIIGIGPTPAEAVNAFDEQFYGTVTPYMQQWLAERERLTSQGIDQNEQQKSNVDPGTNNETSSPS